MLQRCAAALIALCLSAVAAFSQAPEKVDFRSDVYPLLKDQCFGCHGATQQLNGFRLDRRRDAMRGGTIPVIAPGNSDGSRLYHKLIGTQYGMLMPPTGALPPQQIDVIKRWIDQGAEWPDDLAGEAPPAPPDPGASRLMDLLRAGNAAGFKRLLRENPNAANLKGPGGVTPLFYAVLYGDSETVRTLLRSGADPNVRSTEGATALMWAVGDPEKTRLILEAGADPNARSDDGRTPLLIAAGRPGSERVVRLLLDRRANPSVKAHSLFGETNPLIAAAMAGNGAVLRMLIERGADPKTGGPVALYWSLRAECDACFDLLFESTPPPARSMAAVFSAPPFGDGVRVMKLLNRGVDVKAKDPAGRTLLMLAASSDLLPVETVKTLIERGVDLHARTSKGETALEFAKLRGQTPVVDLLVNAKASAGAAATAPKLEPRPAASPGAALARVLPLLQRSDEIFSQKGGCVSCHNNTLTSMAVAAARKHRVPVDDALAKAQAKKAAAFLDVWRERALQGIGIPGDSDTVSYILLGLAAENHPADPATDAMAYYLKSQQWPDGRWRILAHRPPIESSDIQVTAASLRALQVYGPRARRADYAKAVERAADWLRKANPSTTEERAFQILGLKWAGASSSDATIRKSVRELLSGQRPDGGWAQIPSLASDAYATGQALVALAETSRAVVSEPAFTKGLDFLVKAQLEDGSWYVKSRAIPFQPFFESGFPHGHDQWISIAASNWAAMALALAAN